VVGQEKQERRWAMRLVAIPGLSAAADETWGTRLTRGCGLREKQIRGNGTVWPAEQEVTNCIEADPSLRLPHRAWRDGAPSALRSG
jgi:hypothetical protein